MFASFRRFTAIKLTLVKTFQEEPGGHHNHWDSSGWKPLIMNSGIVEVSRKKKIIGKKNNSHRNSSCVCVFCYLSLDQSGGRSH